MQSGKKGDDVERATPRTQVQCLKSWRNIVAVKLPSPRAWGHNPMQ